MKYVLFVDSGLGGATIIKELLNKNCKINFIFHCENRFAPLGNLNKVKLTNLCFKIVEGYLEKYDISLIVLACNTLTSSCIKDLRAKFAIPIVGVEPNIKVQQGNTMVLATKYTIKNCYLLKGLDCELLALPKLSFYIDKYYPERLKINKYLCKKLPVNKNFDNIVLGCTHYILVKEQLQKMFKNARIYDSISGTVKQILRLVDINTLCDEKSIIVLSKQDKRLYEKIKKYIYTPKKM